MDPVLTAISVVTLPFVFYTGLNMHAGGQWSALGTLLGGGTCVLDPTRHLDFAEVCALTERERVVTLNVTGDAHARPFAEFLEEHGHEHDLSSLLLFGSGGSMGNGNWATDPLYAGKVLAIYGKMLEFKAQLPKAP